VTPSPIAHTTDVLEQLLVVEDDEEMARVVARGLAAEGYEVSIAGDGVNALVLDTQVEFAAAVLDINLPGMSGLELCRRLRQLRPHLPIVLLTARDAIDDRVRGLDAGADDYLVKPFALSELAARLRAVRRREQLAPQQSVRVGNLTIDNHDRTVKLGDVLLSLSPKEFLLLRLLATNSGTTVERDHLLMEIWGSVEHTDANVVDQYVSYLRRKLDPAATAVTIVTERGIGYRLIESP
jgi:two-component system, OmpR family, response regulator